MPVQLNELVVRATVENSSSSIQKQGGEKANGAAGGSGSEALVAECVEEVLRILNEKHKR